MEQALGEDLGEELEEAFKRWMRTCEARI